MIERNGNGGINKLLYWIISGCASFFLVISVFVLDLMHKNSQDIKELQIVMAVMKESLSQLTPLVQITRVEQVGRTTQLADLRERILLLEQRVIHLPTRFDAQSMPFVPLDTKMNPRGDAPSGSFPP